MSCAECNGSETPCGCNECNPCTESACPEVSADCESLPSALENFIAAFFGTVTKTVVDGIVTWTLPCNLETGLEGNPRLPGEGLACYFKRLFQDGITGLTGATGPAGVAGAAGGDGFFTLAAAFAHGGSSFVVTDGGALGDGQFLFLPGSGWYQLVSHIGNTAFVSLVLAVSTPVTSVPAGAEFLATGPRGPQGVAGAVGVTGASGAAGAAGAAGTNGEPAFATLQTTFVQPSPGGLTGLLTFSNTGWAIEDSAVAMTAGGYYQIFAKSGNQLNLLNMGSAPNATAGTTINSGETISPSGFEGPAAAVALSPVATKTANYLMVPGDQVILADAGGGVVTVTLPDATGVIVGKEYFVKRTNSGANDVIVDTIGAQTIDGDPDVTIVAQWDFFRGFSDGSNWIISG